MKSEFIHAIMIMTSIRPALVISFRFDETTGLSSMRCREYNSDDATERARVGKVVLIARAGLVAVARGLVAAPDRSPDATVRSNSSAGR